MRRTFFLLLAAVSGYAGEHAVLHNGFRIEADRHEVIGGTIRLHTDQGTMDVPSEQIARFEAEEYVAPAQPAEPTSQAPSAPHPAEPSTPDPKQIVTQAATKHGLRPEFVRSVASAESAFRPDAVSPKGALGLMQLMPGTAADLGADPRNPEQNADAGVRYLKQLLLKYKDSKDPVRLALAAYNAGPGAVDRYRNIPPYRETQAYVEKVVRKYLAEIQRGSPSGTSD